MSPSSVPRPDHGADPAGALGRLAAAVRAPGGPSGAAVRLHLDLLTKPPGSLGRLEELAVVLARAYGDPPPHLRPAVILFAGDHGVTARGVSAYPPAVTGQMCRNLAAGGAAASVLARRAGADLRVIDVGVDADLSGVRGVEGWKVRRGTRDLAAGAAMTAEEVERAVAAGARAVESAAAEGADVIALGEMGIGNTTAAAALGAALLGRPAREMVGRGTGVGTDRLAAKEAAVAAALDRAGPSTDPTTLLAEMGGLEIAALTGAILAAAAGGRVVVLDGFIVGVAALAAVRAAPPVREWLVAGHRSTEPGHAHVLEALGLRPLLELDLRLGEGSGALLALPLLDAAAAVLREMATFDEAGVSGPEGS